MILYNVMYAILFTLCRYVVQVNYSSFDMTEIDNKLAQLQHEDICLNYDSESSQNFQSKITKMFEKMNVPHDKTLYPGIDENGKGSAANLKFHVNSKSEKPNCLVINVS